MTAQAEKPPKELKKAAPIQCQLSHVDFAEQTVVILCPPAQFYSPLKAWLTIKAGPLVEHMDQRSPKPIVLRAVDGKALLKVPMARGTRNWDAWVSGKITRVTLAMEGL